MNEKGGGGTGRLQSLKGLLFLSHSSYPFSSLSSHFSSHSSTLFLSILFTLSLSLSLSGRSFHLLFLFILFMITGNHLYRDGYHDT